MLRLEFGYYDKENKGYISGEDFMKLVAHHSEYRHIPAWLQKNLTTVSKNQISFQQFVAINHIIKDIKQIEVAIRMYTAAGGHIGKRTHPPPSLFVLGKLKIKLTAFPFISQIQESRRGGNRTYHI